MSDETTVRLALPFLSAGQAQKEVTHNEALQVLDLIVQPVCQSASLSAPPASPAVGACWIVAASPTGGWAGHAGDTAQWTAGGWRFAQPTEGWSCHVLDRTATMSYDGSQWRDGPVRSDGFYVADVRVVGAQQAPIGVPDGGAVVDSEARAVIAAILEAMQAHGLIS